MELILLQKVTNLGDLGDLVKGAGMLGKFFGK